ncbi:hypothetical protein D3C75_601490 [compost metagenome]
MVVFQVQYMRKVFDVELDISWFCLNLNHVRCRLAHNLARPVVNLRRLASKGQYLAPFGAVAAVGLHSIPYVPWIYSAQQYGMVAGISKPYLAQQYGRGT